MTTDITQIQDKILTFIVESASADPSKIQADTLIFQQGYFDSMGFVLLITFLEETFGIKTIDADLIETNFESVQAMCDFVLKKLN